MSTWLWFICYHLLCFSKSFLASIWATLKALWGKQRQRWVSICPAVPLNRAIRQIVNEKKLYNPYLIVPTRLHSIWKIASSVKYANVGGLCPAEPPCPSSMRIILPRHDLIAAERWPIFQRRRALSLFLNGLLLGLICIGIQGICVKLISHCQAVMIKQ